MPPTTDLVMPKLGLTMTEGTISEWSVAAGQSFAAGDVVLVVETDKIANEIEAPANGVLSEILVGAGETVPVGAVIGSWDVGAVAVAAGLSPTPTEAREPTAAPPHPASAGNRIVATPLARRIARQQGIDLATVAGSGPRGRIKADDVKTAAAAGDVSVPPPPSLAPIPPARPASLAPRSPERAPTSTHSHLATEIEATALMDLRARINQRRDGSRISVTHFVLAAIGAALSVVPGARRVWRDGGFLELPEGDIGISIATSQGILTPILRGAGSMTLGVIAEETTELARRAREGLLTQEAMKGGAISMSNAGVGGVTSMTAPIQPGQAASLGVGAIRSIHRPDANGNPTLRHEIAVVLSHDPGVLDASIALDLLDRIKLHLEDPMGLLVH